MIFSLFLIAGVALAADVCLPDTHSGLVHVHRWALDDMPDVPVAQEYKEYQEGEFVYIWRDAATRKSLVHIYDHEWYSVDDREREHVMFSLRDYTLGYHWIGNWNYTLQQVTHCRMQLMTEPFTSYCPAKDATKKGSGTIGEDIKADFWESTVVNGTYMEDIGMLVESGTTNLPLQRRLAGTWKNETSGEVWHWSEQIEWFDFKTEAIDPSLFKIPVGCPP